MKLIIDIEESYYEIIKYDVAHSHYKPFMIIANGTPYEERPHGEWIDNNIPYLANCSNCGYQMDTHEEHGYFNYCPYCGADMRNGGDNNG